MTDAPTDPRSPFPHFLASRLGEQEVLDAPAKKVAGAIRGALKAGTLKDALSGTFLGHPLHPLLTDLPIGTWTSASLLDVVGGRDSETAARRLVGAGILAAVPTALTGASDWADTATGSPSARRIGLVHAWANSAALTLQVASYAARRRGGSGKAFTFAAMGALVVGGHLGGHLSYVEGVGVAETTFDDGPKEWTRAAADADLAEGEMISADVGDGVPVLLARQGGRILALHDRCTHRGAPLHNGELEDGCVTCPWHGSRFRLADGSVERGPASVPQPAFATRVVDGQIEVRQATDPTP